MAGQHHRLQDKRGLGMTILNDAVASKWSKPDGSGTFDAMGAAERNLWSAFVRQGEIDRTIRAINAPAAFGAVILGPWGVGKTTLGRAVEAALAPSTHIERLVGTSAETVVAYAPLSLLMARLPPTVLDSPVAIIRGIHELIRSDAAGRDVLLVVDDLPGLDTMTVGVLMHLLMGGTAKLLVLARDMGELPEDLVLLAKDGQLEEIRLDYFTRSDVGELIAKATGAFVSESAVTALHKASNGIPLVLQALFRDQVAKGSIQKIHGGWILKDPINMDASSSLAEIVRGRLARVDEDVRNGLEKVLLLDKAPLGVVTAVVGQEAIWRLEERGFIQVGADGLRLVSVAERYLGDIVRGTLTPSRKAELLNQIAPRVNIELETLEGPEMMSLAAWTLDAGLVLEPRFALAAAANAVRYFDPVLALRCTAKIPSGHRLRVEAAQTRSAAYRVSADYGAAVAELDALEDSVVLNLAIEDFCSWTLALTMALLWVPEGAQRIPELLAAAELRFSGAQCTGQPGAIPRARRLLNLARFISQVQQGEFSVVLAELEAASQDSDREYSLNSACLLVQTLAVVGREVEAVTLGRRIECAVSEWGITPIFSDYYRNGMADAQIWSGLWVDCVQMLREELESMLLPVPYHGGLHELKLGLAHAYAGRGTEAIQVLMSAAAQLEARNSHNALGLAYSALAFCFAQIDSEQDALGYLALARSVSGPTTWTNAAMADFFSLLAMRWLDDPQAAQQLRASAERDIAKGRFTTASMSIFAGSIESTDTGYTRLEEISLRREGPMAELSVLLARSCRTRSAEKALQAAEIAKLLSLDAVESRCAVLALDFAREQSQPGLAKLASERLERLNEHLLRLPLYPQSTAVKLTQREIQVAKLVKRGLGNRAIAGRIGVSIRTVEGHLYQLYSKLGITSRHELLEDGEN